MCHTHDNDMNVMRAFYGEQVREKVKVTMQYANVVYLRKITMGEWITVSHSSINSRADAAGSDQGYKERL